MGEFVGIDPLGAEQLVRQMAAGKDVLARTRHGIEAAIAEAGPSWTGSQGVAAMHRSWALFDETQRDLKWRMDTLKQMVPTAGTGMLSASFAFDSEKEAARQGKADAAPVAEALRQHEVENSVESWRKVTAATAAAKGKLNDPAYAAALLTTLGPDKFRALFMHWLRDKGPAMDKGLPPGVLRQGSETLGPLAEAYANAERAGRLGEEWGGKFMETTQPGVLTALVAMSKPSSGLLNQVALRVLGRPLAADLPTSQNWNLNVLVEAYDADPQALRTLLADHKEAAGWLLHPERFLRTGIPDFETKLAGVLDKALQPGAGDQGTRDRAWLNVIGGVGAEDSPWLGGQWGRAFQDSPISQALARNVTPYLDALARGQAKESSPKLTPLYPAPPWDKLDPDVASRFVGALMQDKVAADALFKASHEYTVGLDIGRFQPFDSDDDVRAGYVAHSALAGGVANLLLAGSTYAEWSDDEYADWIAGVMTLPVDWLSNKYWPIDDPTTATARDRLQDDGKDVLKDFIKDYLDKQTPGTADTVAKKIVDQQTRWVIDSLAQHKQKPLTVWDEDVVEKTFSGRLYKALVDALERRGG
ncbi:hypothetical protein AB0K05_29180 [Nonomuraea sp. NPDC049486]|uniref:hypothetical protein n=1 Tax=Nonomuraea sp. NPDC049486 TaxID=3155773 RepID=UPI0034470923